MIYDVTSTFPTFQEHRSRKPRTRRTLREAANPAIATATFIAAGVAILGIGLMGI